MGILLPLHGCLIGHLLEMLALRNCNTRRDAQEGLTYVLLHLEVGNDQAGELIVTDSMHTRKAKMFELSDAAVVLPGGIGTMDETIEVMTWKQLRQHDKPIVVMNIEGYWDSFVGLIESIIGGGFAHPKIRDLISVVDGADDVFYALANAPEPDHEVLTSHL